MIKYIILIFSIIFIAVTAYYVGYKVCENAHQIQSQLPSADFLLRMMESSALAGYPDKLKEYNELFARHYTKDGIENVYHTAHIGIEHSWMFKPSYIEFLNLCNEYANVRYLIYGNVRRLCKLYSNKISGHLRINYTTLEDFIFEFEPRDTPFKPGFKHNGDIEYPFEFHVSRYGRTDEELKKEVFAIWEEEMIKDLPIADQLRELANDPEVIRIQKQLDELFNKEIR